jgi:putative FmdB family regulatory protein
MPLYDYKCPKCGKLSDIIASICDTTLPCPHCGETMTRLFSYNVNVIPDLEPYLDDNISHNPVWIKSKQHRREEMKKRGLIETG